MVCSKLPPPARVLRLRSLRSAGPSILVPTRTSCARKKTIHCRFKSVALVWMLWLMARPRGFSRSMIAKAFS